MEQHARLHVTSRLVSTHTDSKNQHVRGAFVIACAFAAEQRTGNKSRRRVSAGAPVQLLPALFANGVLPPGAPFLLPQKSFQLSHGYAADFVSLPGLACENCKQRIQPAVLPLKLTAPPSPRPNTWP